ncbi:MAG: NAD(P)-binding protein, partial [Geminicoccaceae bacterium]
MRALVNGGGIGGLTAALSLAERGIEVEVFEQAAEVRELGVGINLLPHAVQELAALGLLAQRGVLPWLAGGLAVVVAAVHVAGHLPQSLNALAGQSSVAL